MLCTDFGRENMALTDIYMLWVLSIFSFLNAGYLQSPVKGSQTVSQFTVEAGCTQLSVRRLVTVLAFDGRRKLL